MLNRVVLIGRLGQDPELRHTASNTPVCSFSIAVDRPQSQANRQAGVPKVTDWINIVVWNQQGVVCAQYLRKGRLVAVDGRLQIRSWTDQQGQKRSTAEVVADTVRFLDRGDVPVGAPPATGATYAEPAVGGGPLAGAGNEIRFPDPPPSDDDLPF
ncbi:MAG: single-stranded DNA-binding protein [Heliobacteriaceae bacterium]|nr:single-stranded DNA-binding protein [Heliobacteriaceae bacterium]MDD4588245.1 single-stranded DNA-binding protein [Heliobacteriaceae bacterium]